MTITTEFTLSFLVREDEQGLEVLLGKKTRTMAIGLRNGFGGKMNPGEDPRDGAARELFEESGVRASVESFESVARLECTTRGVDGGSRLAVVHVFLVRSWIGTPRASAEMTDLAWFRADNLPLEEMMLADQAWAPLVLRDKRKVVVFAEYGPQQEALLGEVKIEEMQ